MYKELVEGKYKLAVVGLGYVGLPIALEFAKKIKVIGFDNKPDRIEKMKQRNYPGDKKHTLSKVVKITSGCDAKSAEEIAKVYELFVEAGIYKANSIKIAEAAKIIEPAF